MPYYTLAADSLTITNPDGPEEVVPISYARAEVDETEFAASFDMEFGVPDISGYTARYQFTLNQGSAQTAYRVYWMDGEIWLASLHGGGKLWSIYRLEPIDASELEAARAPSPQQTALDELSRSLSYSNGVLSFQLPDYEPASDWNILIAGRMEPDGFGRSMHFLTDENTNRSWEAGKKYIILTDGIEGYTELSFSAYLPGKGDRTLGWDTDLLSFAKSQSDSRRLETAVSDAILAHNDGLYLEGEFKTEAHISLSTVLHEDTAEVYLIALYAEYDFPDGVPELVSGGMVPTALRFSKNKSGAYALEEYREASDGKDYASSIREMFPPDAAEQVLDGQTGAEQLRKACDEKAAQYLAGRLSEADLVQAVLSSPLSSSDPSDYIAAYQTEFNTLVSRGDTALRYIYEKFLADGQTGLEGHILFAALQSIAGDEVPDVTAQTAQAQFNAFALQVRQEAVANGEEYLAKYRPASYLLLQMMDQ
jgi:hypothetical protein